MQVRRKSDFPTKDKRISIAISEVDMNRFKNITKEYNLVFLDIIKKGIECIQEGNFDTDYSVSGNRNKRLSVKATEDELNLIRTITKENKIKYLDVAMIGLKYYEKL